jgi:hypothetical protein
MKKSHLQNVDTMGIISTVDTLIDQLVQFGAVHGLQEADDNFGHLIERVWDEDLYEKSYVETVKERVNTIAWIKYETEEAKKNEKN